MVNDVFCVIGIPTAFTCTSVESFGETADVVCVGILVGTGTDDHGGRDDSIDEVAACLVHEAGGAILLASGGTTADVVAEIEGET